MGLQNSAVIVIPRVGSPNVGVVSYGGLNSATADYYIRIENHLHQVSAVDNETLTLTT